MGARIYSIIAALAILASIGLVGAAQPSTPTSLSTFYSKFNVSSTVQSALVYKNISYNGGNYLLAYYNGNPYFLLNATSGYSFVLDPVEISLIITPTIIQSSISQINLTYLSDSLAAYNKSSAQPLQDCITETGLNQPNASCTTANFCESCRTVPVCNKVLTKVGYGSPFTVGINILQSNYTALISNISIYEASLTGLESASTAQAALANLQSAFGSISTITQNIGQNPVFPPPPNANFGQCANYGSATGVFNPKSSNWVCSAIGFCQFLTYNYTKLNDIQGYISRIDSLPMSSTQIAGVAQSVSSNGNKYALVILTEEDLALKNRIDNTTLAGYNAVAAGVALLGASISNASLTAKFNTLSANYSKLQNSYATANLVALNATLAKQFAALKALYLPLNASYFAALKTSQNNTAMLLSLESESSTPGQQVVSLSFQEASLNDLLTSKPSNIAAIDANLSALNKKISQVPHTAPILSEVSRSIGVPFASVLLGSSSFASETANAPLVATIPAIIISIVIFAALYLLYRRLRVRGRIRRMHSTSRNWKILFVIAAVVLLLYILESYSSAAIANASSPLASAASAIGYAKSVVIAINGTSNPSLLACQTKIYGVLKGQLKNVSRISINGQACVAGSSIQTTDECMGHYIATGTPVIILTNSTKNTLTAYSFYGTVLSQSGNAQFTNACLASLFLG